MTLGLDLSHHNGRWEPKQAGCDFVIAKASEGGTFVDPRYAIFREQAQREHLRWGAYHVIRETSQALEQAVHFLKHARLGAGDVAALDLETQHAKSILLREGSTKGAREFVLAWLDTVRDAHCIPLFYVSTRGLKVLTNGWREPLGALAQFPLWLCQYVTLASRRPGRLQKGPDLPPTHTDWAVWQYTSSGVGAKYGLGSGKVDLNLLNGSLQRWDEWAVQAPFNGKASGR